MATKDHIKHVRVHVKRLIDLPRGAWTRSLEQDVMKVSRAIVREASEEEKTNIEHRLPVWADRPAVLLCMEGGPIKQPQVGVVPASSPSMPEHSGGCRPIDAYLREHRTALKHEVVAQLGEKATWKQKETAMKKLGRERMAEMSAEEKQPYIALAAKPSTRHRALDGTLRCTSGGVDGLMAQDSSVCTLCRCSFTP